MDGSISKPSSLKQFTSISNCKLTTFSKVSLTSVFVYHLVMTWIHTKRMKQNLNISTPLDALDREYSIFKTLLISLQSTWTLEDGLVTLKTPFRFAARFTKTILCRTSHGKKKKRQNRKPTTKHKAKPFHFYRSILNQF